MRFDAVVVGSGPNGLAAAVTLARAGLEVTVFERSDYIGGGASTLELTEPGEWHDLCSAVHPMAVTSDFFRRFGLGDRVELLTPEISYAQPLDDGRAAIAYRDLERTAHELGVDGPAWRRLFAPYARHPDRLTDVIGNPMLPLPRRPFTALRYGMQAMLHGSPAWNSVFRSEEAPALLTGVFAHTIQRLPSLGTAAAGLALAALAHGAGWPIPRGGSGAISRAMVADLEAHGGRVITGTEITNLRELPPALITMLDIGPRGLLELDDGTLSAGFRRSMRRFRYGNAAAKADFVLSEPVPWRDERMREAVTVHLGGPRSQIVSGENAVAAGAVSTHPYVLTCQPTVLDPTRSGSGRHIFWAYTHVPSGSRLDPLESIVRRVEHFAPGFRDTIVASSSFSADQLSRREINDVGGDIAAGDVSTWQLIARPRLSATPWDTPRSGTYLCSASTVPGPGVHGQGGWLAARRALRRELGIVEAPNLAPESNEKER